MKTRILTTTLLLGGTTALAAAQDLLPKAGPQTRPVLIRGATVHTVADGTLEDADVLFTDGEIAAVAEGRLPGDAVGDAEVLDGAGKHVYPGWICATSVLGLEEVGSVDMTIDQSEAGSLNPEVYAAVAVNPDSWLIPVARRNGVLTAGVLPRGGLVPGRMSVLRMDGWTWEDMALRRDAGLVVRWPFMGTRTGRFARFRRGGGDSSERSIERLDELFDAAAAYRAARRADPSVPTDLRLESMARTLDGETPVYVEATTVEQIESAVTWARERGLELVLLGARDAGECIDLLLRHDVFVAIPSPHRTPHRRDLSYASTFELPALLEDAGVRWCMTHPTGSASSVRNLPYDAASATAFGLDRDAAVRSITLSAAECLGVADTLGSLEEGKSATLFVCDGDPFEFATTIEAAFVDGRRIDLRDKQTELAAKYREKYRQLGRIQNGR